MASWRPRWRTTGRAGERPVLLSNGRGPLQMSQNSLPACFEWFRIVCYCSYDFWRALRGLLCRGASRERPSGHSWRPVASALAYQGRMGERPMPDSNGRRPLQVAQNGSPCCFERFRTVCKGFHDLRCLLQHSRRRHGRRPVGMPRGSGSWTFCTRIQLDAPSDSP